MGYRRDPDHWRKPSTEDTIRDWMLDAAREGRIVAPGEHGVWNAHRLLGEYCVAHNIKIDTVPPHSLLEMAAIRASDILNNER